jgi:5-methylcytosine-specific restriction endonuclease McrA
MMRRSGPCRVCGNPLRTGRAFCSPRCQYDARLLIRKPCLGCGGPRRGRSETRFCSWACYNAQRHRGMKARGRPCKECGSTFVPPGSRRLLASYCSLACAVTRRGRRLAFIAVECQQCGKAFRRTRAAVERVTRSFCSPECSWLAHAGRGHSFYRGGSEAARGPKWQVVAQRIRARDGHVCRRCGKSQQENGRRLSVDHIIPWRIFPEDQKVQANEDSNLASLCTSCHSKKTMVAEHRWLKGDRFDFSGYVRSLGLRSGATAG